MYLIAARRYSLFMLLKKMLMDRTVFQRLLRGMTGLMFNKSFVPLLTLVTFLGDAVLSFGDLRCGFSSYAAYQS